MRTTHTKTSIEHNIDSLFGLEQNVQNNNMRAKEMFLKLKQLQECYEHTYSNLTKEEVDLLTRKLEEMNGKYNMYNMKSTELSDLCRIIRKYIDSIKEIHDNKIVYKHNIQHTLNQMYAKVQDICDIDKNAVTVGTMYNLQLDNMKQLRSKLIQDYETDSHCCEDIKKIHKLIKQYHSVICKRLNAYTTQLKTLHKNSKNYSKTLEKVAEYRILYGRLITYTKHYKIIIKERDIACKNKEANISHVKDVLVEIETNLKRRVRVMNTFLAL